MEVFLVLYTVSLLSDIIINIGVFIYKSMIKILTILKTYLIKFSSSLIQTESETTLPSLKP